MKYTLVLILFVLTGCSYKTTEFFEDLIADNTVIKSDGRYQNSVEKDARTPILTTKKSEESCLVTDEKIQKYRGKIARVHFDKDFNLYVYTFIDHITHKPIIFYYDKNIHHNQYKGDYRVEISGNYLIKYRQINKVVTKNSYTEKEESKNITTYKVQKKYKKRKRSSIKVPVEEKISPL